MGPGKEMTIWSGQGPAENLGSWTREEAAGVLWGGGRYGILACCFLQVMVFSGPLTAGRFCSWDRGPQPGGSLSSCPAGPDGSAVPSGSRKATGRGKGQGGMNC